MSTWYEFKVILQRVDGEPLVGTDSTSKDMLLLYSRLSEIFANSQPLYVADVSLQTVPGDWSSRLRTIAVTPDPIWGPKATAWDGFRQCSQVNPHGQHNWGEDEMPDVTLRCHGVWS